MSIGQRARVLDATARVTGRLDYVLNRTTRGCLSARLLRSPHAHADVTRLDATSARRLPEVTVLTGSDLDRWPGLRPWDQTTSSSRSTAMMGGAVREAATSVRQQVLDIASRLLEVDPADLIVEDGAVKVVGAPDRLLSLAEVVRRSRQGNLLGHGAFASEGGLDPDTGQGIATHHFAQSACAAEVEVDLQTGKLRVLDLRMAAYAGRVVHPTYAELQVEGNAAFGLGQALMEEMVYDEGQLVNPNLGEYLVPSLQDMPPHLGVQLVEDPERGGEIHGLGEGGAPVVPPAIANAVFAACGVALDSLPITPERVLRSLLRSSEGGHVAPGSE